MQGIFFLGLLILFLPAMVFSQNKVEALIWNVGDKWKFIGDEGIEAGKADPNGYIQKVSDRKCISESQASNTMSSDTKVYAIVFSDLHLGSRQSTVTVESISGIIKKHNPTVVVYAGDTVDLFASVKNITYLDKLKAIPGKNIFLAGNHDPIETFEQSVIFDLNGKKIKIFHGHNEEPWYARWSDWLATKINEFILQITKFNIQNWARRKFAKEFDGKKYVPYLYKEMMTIIDEYKNGYFDVVISGHTHYAERREIGKFLYINLGDWNNYAIIYETGDILLDRI